MKINKDKLVELLVEKTEMEKAEVESQLNELIKRITSAAERGKALEIKGFGLFYFDEKGDLKFDPADELKTEINFKYAGMEPVELKPPRDTSTSKEDSGEPVSDDDIFGIEDELIAEEEKGKINFDEFDHDKSDDSDDEDEEENPFASILKDAASGIKDKDEKEVKKAGTAPNVSSRKKSAKEEPKKKTASTKKTKSSGQKDPVMMVVFVLLGVVVLAGGYFIINDYLNAPEQSANSETEVPVEEPPTVAEQDLTEVEPEAEDTVEDPEPVAESTTEAPALPTYGLYGDIVDSGNNGYTIVLHSLRSESRANEIAGELKDDGYRTMVTGRTVDGRAVFRVSVGQFPSISDAQEEAAELPTPHNEQNFIQRIRN